MALNQAQLVNPPASGRTGGVKQGANITIGADGTISAAGGVPSGAVMIFVAASAPTGWTQVTTAALNDAAIRLVTGTGGGTGGTINFSAFFNATSTYSGAITLTAGSVGGATLTVNQLAAHTHQLDRVVWVPAGGGPTATRGNEPIQRQTPNTLNAGANDFHTHSLVGAAASGTFTSDFNVKYVNMIICSKD